MAETFHHVGHIIHLREDYRTGFASIEPSPLHTLSVQHHSLSTYLELVEAWDGTITKNNSPAFTTPTEDPGHGDGVAVSQRQCLVEDGDGIRRLNRGDGPMIRVALFSDNQTFFQWNSRDMGAAAIPAWMQLAD